MEALVLIIGEIIFAILAPFFILVVDVLGLVLSLIFSLFSDPAPGRDETTRDRTTQSETRRDRRTERVTITSATRRTARLGAMILAGIALLALAAIGVVNTFYFSDSVRYVFDTVEKRSGIATTCQDISGSIFAGRIDLRDCTIARPSHPASTLELSVARFALDLRVTSLPGTAYIDSAEVDGLVGWVKKNQSVSSSADRSEEVEKPRREFVIGHLDVTNVNLELSGVNPDGNPFSLPIEIQQIDSRPLRSRMALFDMLFRSNVSGSIAGAPFDISTSGIEGGRKTEWRAPNIPVASLGAVAGGPLSWFSQGTVDVLVIDEWQRNDSLSIDMDWRLKFSDVEVKAPPGTGAFTRIASTPVTRYVNGHDGHFPFEFSLVINENQFESRSSLAAAGLWSAVGDAVKLILTSFSIEEDEAADLGGAVKKGVKSVLDALRKPKNDEPDQID